MDNDEKDLSEVQFEFFQTSVEGNFNINNQCPCKCNQEESE